MTGAARRAVLGLAAVLSAAAAPPLLVGGAAADPVAAVARLNHAGYRERMHCSASLIGPREVVTARHCVEGLVAGDLHVLLGYDRGAFARHARVASVDVAPDEDVARLCLDADAPMAPLAASADAPGPGPARALGYPASRAHAQDARACGLVPVAGRRAAMLDCPMEPGMSGAPVSMGEGEDARVVGVVSASGEGRSLAALLGALPAGGCEAQG